MSDAPHLALPFAWGADGHALTNEQDSPSDVAACVAALCLTPIGWRAEQIEYGLEELVFALDVADAALVGVIQRWEPRADPLLVESDDADLLAKHVSVTLEEASP